MVECTGLENQQSRKVLVGSNPTASARLSRLWRLTAVLSAGAAAAVLMGACAGVPGETLTDRSVRRSIHDRVLMLARSADPQCRTHKVSSTEVLEVHRDGKPAEELWVVEHCGRRTGYAVTFAPTPRNAQFQVRPQ